jgi:O-antigen/teichoic acid export membrane protein
LNVYNDLGLTESLQYFLPRYRIKKQYNYVKTAIYISLIAQILTVTIIAIFLWFWAPWLATHYFHSPQATTILKYFCLYFLWINIFQSLQSIFMAFQDTFNYQFTEMLRNRAILWFTFFFFITGQWNIANYSLNWILWLASGILIAWIIFLRKYRKHMLQWKIVIEKPMLKEYINYALRCFLWLNVIMLFGQITQQIVIVMIGPEAAGYYTNFFSLFMITNVILWPILGLIYPLVSELITKNDWKKISILYNFFYTYFSIAALSLSGIFLSLWKEIALIIYGKKFILSWILFSWSAIFTVFVVLFWFNYFVLAGIGKIKERVKILWIATIVNILLDIVLIKYMGIYWAMISLAISWFILFILSYRLIIKIHKIQIDKKFVIKNSIVITALTISIFLIKNKIFIFDDIMRFKNLWSIILLTIGFYLLFIWFNYKKLFFLKKELQNLRKIK